MKRLSFIRRLKNPKGWSGRKMVFTVFFGVVLAGGIFTAYLLFLYANLPSVEQIDTRQVAQSTRIYDRTGKVLLYEISGAQRRTLVPWNQIPQTLKDATLAIEDQSFYSEPAFSWKGILRAALANLERGQIVQGASTITQQLARNAFLSSEQTFSRKIKELLLAIRLSRHYSKDRILELYLNEVPFGPTLYGVGSASEAYFGKPASELTLAQTALLASVLKAPSYYSPWGSHTKELLERQRLVLQRMLDLGKVSRKQFDLARTEKLEYQPQGFGIKAPHFVMAVQDYLIKKYGEDMVRTGGLNVVTTLDWDLEQLAEKVVAEGAARNESLYDGRNAALVAQNATSGQILAIVGSRDYFDIKNEGNFNVATQGLRQPGSVLKPFVYLTAFAKGYAPQTLLFDAPTEFRPNDSRCPSAPDLNSANDYCFHPQNFDGNFRGPISMQQALAQSVNVPAVETLYLVGLKDTLNTLNNFGVTTLDEPSRYGLSLVLGGGEVKLVDLVGAYSVLATEGVHHDQTIVLEVKDGSGNVLESFSDHGAQVIDPQYPRLIDRILSDSDLRAGLFSSSLPLTVFPGYDVALKTGTTNDYRDAWAMGYTPSLVVGVWAGNNNNAPMQRHGSSILAAVPIWHDFLVEALKSQPSLTFNRPNEIMPQKPILAGVLSGPPIHSLLYYVDRNNPSGPEPAEPGNDPQFGNWEVAVQAWAENHPDVVAEHLAPTQNALIKPGVVILAPQPGAYITNTIHVQAQINSPTNIQQVVILWNGQIVKEWGGLSLTNYTLNYDLTPGTVGLQNSLVVRVVSDNVPASAETIVYH